MAEKEQIYSSKVKYEGIFNFKEFYKFCYDWLTEETGLKVLEDEYSEKITGNAKELKIIWKGFSELTDYFKFEIKVEFHILNMVDVEINQEGVKIKTNKGIIKTTVKGDLVRDYKGKFETSAFNKFIRGIYEKYMITQRVLQFEDYIVSKCDEFLGQSKAYLDLEGKSRHQ